MQIKTQNVKTSFRQQGETENPRRSKSRPVPRMRQVPASGAGRSRPDKSRSVPANNEGRRSDPGRRKGAIQQAKASSRNTADKTSSREKLQPEGQGYQDQCQGGDQLQPPGWGEMKTTPASRAIPAARGSSSKASAKRSGKMRTAATSRSRPEQGRKEEVAKTNVREKEEFAKTSPRKEENVKTSPREEGRGVHQDQSQGRGGCKTSLRKDEEAFKTSLSRPRETEDKTSSRYART